MKRLSILFFMLIMLSSPAYSAPCHITLCAGGNLLMTTGDNVNSTLRNCGTGSTIKTIFIRLFLLGVFE